MPQMTPTYHLPPDFSTPPDGPYQLGTIIRDFDHHSKMRPLNRSHKSRVDIPAEEVYTDHKDGFEASRARLKSGELGIWAKFFGIEGVGVETSLSIERAENYIYKFDSVDTSFFHPSPAYISESMELPEVKDYLTGTSYKKPVFLVTGLKVAKGVTVEHSKSSRVSAVANVGFNSPDVAAGQVGLGASATTERSPGFSFSGSTDIVVGIQCYKVYYTPKWLWGGRRLKEEIYEKGAEFLDDDDTDGPDHDAYILGKEDDFDHRINDLVSETAAGMPEPWVVPRTTEVIV